MLITGLGAFVSGTAFFGAGAGAAGAGAGFVGGCLVAPGGAETVVDLGLAFAAAAAFPLRAMGGTGGCLVPAVELLLLFPAELLTLLLETSEAALRRFCC